MGIEILTTILQYVAIVAGVFGVIVAFVCIFKDFSVPGLIVDVFVIFFCVCIVLSEVYIFDFFKYIAFIITFWGKGILYLLMGFFIFSQCGALGIISAIIFWVLFVFYLIVGFKVKQYNPPLLQKNSQPTFSVSEADYFNEGGAGNDGGSPPPQENPPQ